MEVNGKCKECRYWRWVTDKGVDNRTKRTGATVGECRIRSVVTFPLVFDTDWCGEFSDLNAYKNQLREMSKLYG